MKYLAAVFTLLSTGAWADDCKPISDALAKTATVPNHALIISKQVGKVEIVHTENAYYETFQGVWKLLPYDDAEQAARMISAFQGKKADCILLGAETIGDQAVQHYAATEHLKNNETIQDFWISSTTGQLLKSVIQFRGDEITMTYDYADIKAPM